jgi:hypothetical protein
LFIGLGAAGAGAYLGFGTVGVPLALPGGQLAADPETLAIVMLASGALTMVLGAISILRGDQY